MPVEKHAGPAAAGVGWIGFLRAVSGALVLVSLPSLATGQSLLRSIPPGNAPVFDREWGLALAAGGDIDGDGIPDLLVTSRDNYFGFNIPRPGLGSVHIVSGASGGALWRSLVPLAGYGAGASIVSLADVNGDGATDFLVGTASAVSGSPQFNANQARVTCVSGKDGTILYEVDKSPSSSSFGSCLAVLGLIDGDAIPDFAVGALGSFVSILSGANGVELLHIPGSLTNTADFLAAAGDVNADGVPDLIVGAPSDSTLGFQEGGRATIFSGANGAYMKVFQGKQDFAHVGRSIAGAGDVDGDGHADYFVNLNSSSVSLISGKTSTSKYAIPAVDAAIAILGDVDGDGGEDVALGEPDQDRVTVYSVGAGVQIYQVAGHPTSRFGHAISAIGDLDGDSREDLAVSAPREELGRVHLYSSAATAAPGAAVCTGDGLAGACPCPYPPTIGEDFDTGSLPAGWIQTGIWHVTSACAGCGSSDPYAYFGFDATCKYFDAPTQNSLISAPVRVPPLAAGGHVELSYCSSIEMDMEGNRAWVLVHAQSGATKAFYAGHSIFNQWYKDPQPYVLDEFQGQTIQIEWYFYNDFVGWIGGWRVDDVSLAWQPAPGASQTGSKGEGCLNSTGAGAVLAAVGSPSVVADDMVLSAVQMPPQSQGLFLVGPPALAQPLVIGGGLLCVGEPALRLGASSTGPFGALHLASPVASSAGAFVAGRSYVFQAWYRDNGAASPCGTTSNSSNGYLVTFTP
jgi:hypothetical protein